MPRLTTKCLPMKTATYKTVWLSDIHLGSKDCKADFLLDFLLKTRCEQLFLVGDVVDLWAMRRQVYWPSSHHKVLQHILHLAQSGTRVVYVPGNHDEPLRAYCGSNYQDLEVHREYVYDSIAHGKLLMLHGDEFDGEVSCGRFHAWVGDHGYAFLLFLNRWYNRWRGRLGFSYWSLANYLKKKVKNANAAIERFENAALQEVRRRGLKGIICGHIHSPNIRRQDGLLYVNDGDWVESCTAVVEHRNGEIELLHWSDNQVPLKLVNLAYTATEKAA